METSTEMITDKEMENSDDSKQSEVTVTEFLGAFFPDENEKIHLRTIKAKDIPEHIEAYAKMFETTRREFLDDTEVHEELATLNINCGIYFVVNSGGNSDAKIDRYNAFFAENDELSIEEQLIALDNAPIQPSIRVETKKSVHAYWLINGECLEDDWREIQALLIQHFNGDEKIKNLSRCMRLPFFNHVLFNGNEPEYKKVEIVDFDTEKRFTVEEMKEAFSKVETSESEFCDDCDDCDDSNQTYELGKN
jgi:hypothetical protein